MGGGGQKKILGGGMGPPRPPPPPPPSKVKWSAPHAKFLTERHKCFIIPSQFSVSDHNKNLFTDINVY